jgi:ribonuclease J
MLKSKLADFGGKLQLPIEEVPLDSRFKVGPFDLELISVAHSIPEPNAVAIRTDLGTVLHTGDWKIDATPTVGPPTDEAGLRQLGADGVLAMICDSTNALREGRSPSETDVAKSLAGIIRGAKRRVAVTIFASNVARIQGGCGSRQGVGRHVVVAGRAMHRSSPWPWRRAICRPGSSITTSGISPIWSRTKWFCCAPAARASRVLPSRALPRTSIPRCSWTRATSSFFLPHHPRQRAHGRPHPEPAHRSRLRDRHRWRRAGARHRPPRREELKEMYGWVKPRIAIPMHGEARHLSEHAKLARAAGVQEVLNVRNGDMVRLAPGAAEIVDEAPVGRLFRDGQLLVPSDDGPVRERRSLAFAGVVIVALVGLGGARWRPTPRSHSTACRPSTRKGGRWSTSCARRSRAPSPAFPATGAGTGSWCAKPCAVPCAPPWKTRGASGRSPRCCWRRRHGEQRIPLPLFSGERVG